MNGFQEILQELSQEELDLLNSSNHVWIVSKYFRVKPGSESSFICGVYRSLYSVEETMDTDLIWKKPEGSPDDAMSFHIILEEELDYIRSYLSIMCLPLL